MAAERVLQAGEVRLARVESVRALAALAVLLGHLWLFAHLDDPRYLYDTHWHRLLIGGGYGVFVFFALSGYLLFWPFVRGADVDLARYARNRALRILPLYWFAVVVLVLVNGEGWTQLWRHVLFVQSLWTDSLIEVDGPLWSVAVEIQFYALLPLLAALLLHRRALAAPLLLALGVASALAREALETENGGLWSYQMVTTFHFFVAGMLLALLRRRWEERPPAGWWARSDLWALASLVPWALVIHRFEYDELVAVAAFLLVGAVVLPLRQGVVVRILDRRPLALLGVASYSLYVWHVPIVEAFDVDGFAALALAATPVCLVVAAASYLLVERPFLRLRRRWSPAAAQQAES